MCVFQDSGSWTTCVSINSMNEHYRSAPVSGFLMSEQLQNIMQLAGAVVDLMDLQGASVMVCLENGWDITTQVCWFNFFQWTFNTLSTIIVQLLVLQHVLNTSVRHIWVVNNKISWFWKTDKLTMIKVLIIDRWNLLSSNYVKDLDLLL